MRSYPRSPAAERQLFQFLSVYRYFSYMVAVGLIVVVPIFQGQDPPLASYIALLVIGIYVVFRVVVPYYPRPGSLLGYLSLGADLAIALVSLLATGGLHSGLLLYSLAPTLVAALLLEQRVAYLTAAATALPLLVVHTALRQYPWILEGNNLALFWIYVIAVSLVALVPYRTNLNLRRRLTQEASVAERLRLRREVHDTLAQDLGFLNLRAKQIQESLSGHPSAPSLAGPVAELQQALQRTYADVRRYLDALTLGADIPLATALADLAREFARRTQTQVETHLPSTPLDLSPMERAQLLGIAREALTNVEKHSQARHVRLSVEAKPQAVELRVIDDGVGFEMDGAATLGHYGLMGMKERAEELGASLTVTSSPGQGTQVLVQLPS